MAQNSNLAVPRQPSDITELGDAQAKINVVGLRPKSAELAADDWAVGASSVLPFPRSNALGDRGQQSTAPTLDGVLDCIRPLIEAGASLHWLVPFEKRPIANDWTNVPVQSEADLRRAYQSNANIGIRLGEPSKIDDYYLHLIDLDIRNADLAAEAWAKLLELWPAAKKFPTCISGSGGESRHVYFLTDRSFPKKKLAKSTGFAMVWDDKKQREVRKYDWEIDILGTGSQAVIPPSIHPDTKLPYTWGSPLDLDLPFLLSIDAALVESWGVSATSTEPDEDEDDLFALVRNAPMDLDDEKIDDILDGLPEDWVDDRDQWLTVGAALHHQFEGSNKGFELWNEWSKQSPKFDVKDSARVWKSFKGSKHPVRMATLIQAANAHKMSQELDLDFDDAPSNLPATLDDNDFSDLLGSDPAPAQAVKKDEPYPDWQQLMHRNEEGDLKTTLHNVALMSENDLRIFGVIFFNNLRKEGVLRKQPPQASHKRNRVKPIVNLDGPHWDVHDAINGDPLTPTHLNEIRRMFEAPTTQGGYGIKITERDLYAAIDSVARKRSFHPVRERLESVVWDGRRRAETLFVDYLGCDDTPYHREAAKLFLIGAVARIYQPGHKFDFVPILEGAQGQGKSTFIRILGLDWFRELTGDISKPQDAVAMLSGAWILEIGELSSMHRSEVNDLKAFISRQVDTARMPYERTSREFPRQCVFMGSTNDEEYLRDITGGRRFWPIKCKLDAQIDNPRLRREIMQIWAEALHIYRKLANDNYGELPLYMADEQAAAEAALMQESRRVETAEETLAGQILAWLDKPIGVEERFDDLEPGSPKTYRQETCIGEVWNEMLGRDGSPPPTESIRIGRR